MSVNLKILYWAFGLLMLVTANPLIVSGQDKTEYPTSGYDTNAFNPAFIQSKDGMFNVHFGGYTQFRYNQVFLQNAPDSVESYPRGYNLARTRLFLEGDLTNQFYYHFRANINGSNTLELMVAYLQWNINKKMYLRMGKQFMALGREDWILPQDLASIDFSAHDFTFAVWTSLGFQFHHKVSKNIRYWVGIGNGAYGARRTFPDPKDSDLAVSSRLEWNLNGSDWDKYDDMLGRKGRDFGMLIGVGIGNNTRFDSETLKTDAKNSTQINVDYTVSGDGFQFFVHGSSTSFEFSNGVTEDYTTNGMYATLGYWFTDKLFGYGRYDYVGYGNLPSSNENYSAPGVGVSVYPFTWTNRVRFTLEYNHLAATIDNTIVEPDGQLGNVATPYGGQQSLRFQAQFGF
jgi:hypothetical protein